MRAATIAATALVLALGAPDVRAGRAAFFVFDVPPHPEQFTVKIVDPATIARARRVLSGEETQAVHVLGTVRRRSARWNRPWHFVMKPGSVQFFEVAIEVCDASIAYVEEHLDEVGGAFLPGRTWCPWGSRLLREVVP